MDPERRKRMLIVVTAICIGAWAADRLVLTQGINVWQERSERIREFEENLAESGGLLDREADLKARWESMKQQSLSKNVSDAESTVFQAVSRWAGDSQLTISSLRPRWGRIAPIAQTLEIQLEGVGNMEVLAKFLYELERDPLPLRVEDVRILAQDEKGERLGLSVRFTGLVLEEASS